jgi:chemotaxis protein MotB
MSAAAPRPPVIVIRRKAAHGGHHGGAWKVAYADFVTAMMALFIVLWLMNSSVHVRKAVAGYFNDPSGKSSETGTDRAGSSDSLPVTRDNVDRLKEQIEQAVRSSQDLKGLSKQVEITVTPEGLRIELLEERNGTFFETGSAQLSDKGQELLTLITAKLRTLPNRLSIEGHTDAQPFASGNGYSNWELSTDRANSARRLMQAEGLRPNQVAQVRGYADQRLRLADRPLDPGNRRISLIVQYADAPPPAAKAESTAAAASR